MKLIREIAAELLGLVVDDGNFALYILGVVLIAALLAFGVHAPPLVTGAVLFLGCLAALAESTLRAARKR